MTADDAATLAQRASARPSVEGTAIWTALCELLDEMLPFLDEPYSYQDRQKRLDERFRWFDRAEHIAVNHIEQAEADLATALRLLRDEDLLPSLESHADAVEWLVSGMDPAKPVRLLVARIRAFLAAHPAPQGEVEVENTADGYPLDDGWDESQVQP